MKVSAKKKAPSKAKKGSKKFCKQSGCKSPAAMKGYCRLHYISQWKEEKANAAQRRLNAYVDHIVKKYPKDYLDRIREGLESDEKFREAMNELDLDNESKETDREFLEKFERNRGDK